MSAVVPHAFEFDESRNPWHDSPVFAPYPPDDSRRITAEVLRVCRAVSTCALVPVLSDLEEQHYYYVAILRGVECVGERDVNVVQVRLDFSANGKPVARERPVLVPDSIQTMFPCMTFASANMASSDISMFFWDKLWKETAVQCGLRVCAVPVPALFHLNASISTLRNCFTAAIHPAGSLRAMAVEDSQQLSAILMECAGVPTALPSAMLMPLDVFGSIPRAYVAVSRDAGSLNVNVVYVDENMKQLKLIFPQGPGLPATFILQVTSRRLTRVEKQALFQPPVHAVWTRPINRIEPVGCSVAVFASPPVPHAFQLRRVAAAGGVATDVPFSQETCVRLQEAVALVCCGGGPEIVLVPVNERMPRLSPITPDPRVNFVILRRRLRTLEVVYMVFSHWGHTPNMSPDFIPVHNATVLIPATLTAAMPHMVFAPVAYVFQDLRDAVFWDVMRSVWSGRIDSLLNGTHPQPVSAAASGVRFEYLADTASTVAYDAKTTGLLEAVLLVVRADPDFQSVLIPLPASEGRNAFTAVVRTGANNLMFAHVFKDRIAAMRVRSIRVLNCTLPRLAQSGPAAGAPASAATTATTSGGTLSDHDVLTLFCGPVFSYWMDVYRDNPHNWTPRAVAFSMGEHDRLGANSPLRFLDAELLGAVAKLCLQ